MLIGELSQRTSLPVYTIRFYEREGLIDARFFKRGDNRYRHYTEEAVERVEMIKHGQAAGYTLAEVRELLSAWDAGLLTDEAQIFYLREKISEISNKIAELESMRMYLTRKLTHLEAQAETTLTETVD